MNISARKILFAILAFSFLVRLAGISYGLPLWVAADEPPFVLGTLKMIELKTLVPRFHLEEFRSVLYYPPYISYLYLPSFLAVLGVKFLAFDGESGSFGEYIGSDLSDFFITARIITVLLAAFSIFLVYKTSKNIFRDEYTALASSFFLGTSLLHITLSMVSRQWLLVSLVLITVLYFLTEPSFSFKRRYLLSVLTSGLGFGISAIAGVSASLIALFYLFFENKKITELLREKFIYLLILMFVFWVLLPLLLYPASLGFKNSLTFFSDKSFSQLFLSPFNFLKPLLSAEPILVLLSIVGLFFLVRDKPKIFLMFVIFYAIYAFIFYLAFRFEERFLTPLLPIIALAAGFGFAELYRRRAIIAVLLLLPAVFSLRFAYLAYQNDSRANLRAWIEENLPEGSRLMVGARLMRLSSIKDAIEEQKMLDENSLRQADRSELYFGKSPIYKSFHALNFYSVQNPDFYENFEKYFRDNFYEYLVLSREDFMKNPQLYERLRNFAESGEPLASFGEDAEFSISESKLGRSPLELFKIKGLGPEAAVYKLK